MNAVASLRIYCSFTLSIDVDKDSINQKYRLQAPLDTSAWTFKGDFVHMPQVPKSRTFNILSKNAQFYLYHVEGQL